MLSDKFIAKNPAEQNVETTLREYEAAHAVWMNTSTFTAAGVGARTNMNLLHEKFVNAVKAAHPTWCVM